MQSPKTSFFFQSLHRRFCAGWRTKFSLTLRRKSSDPVRLDQLSHKHNQLVATGAAMWDIKFLRIQCNSVLQGVRTLSKTGPTYARTFFFTALLVVSTDTCGQVRRVKFSLRHRNKSVRYRRGLARDACRSENRNMLPKSSSPPYSLLH